MVRKIIFISFTFIIFNVLICSKSSSKFNYVNPQPPFCTQKFDLVCASTASAMVMKYWANVDVVHSKDCVPYQEEFRECFGTKNGDTDSYNKILVCLQKIMKKNYIDKNKYDNDPVIDYYKPNEYDQILKNIKYSQRNDIWSPWDRSGVFRYTEKKIKKPEKIIWKMHAVCLIGCRIREIRGIVIYDYKFLDGKYNSSDRRHRRKKSYKKKLNDKQIKDVILFCWSEKCVED